MDIFGGCSHKTSGIGGIFLLEVSGLPVVAHEKNVAVLNESLGCSQHILSYNVFGVAFLDLVLYCHFSVPRRRPVCCVCPRIAFVSWVICYPTYLTGWVDGSWFFFNSVVVIIVGIVVILWELSYLPHWWCFHNRSMCPQLVVLFILAIAFDW